MIIVSDKNVFVRRALARIIQGFVPTEDIRQAANDNEASDIAWMSAGSLRLIVYSESLQEAYRLRKLQPGVTIVMASENRPLNHVDLDIHWFDRNHEIPQMIEFLRRTLTPVAQTA